MCHSVASPPHLDSDSNGVMTTGDRAICMCHCPLQRFADLLPFGGLRSQKHTVGRDCS